MSIEVDSAQRVLVLAPVGRDGELLVQAAGAKGLHATAFANADAFCGAFREGCGAVLLTEEALYVDRAERLKAAVEEQPAWSEVPFVVLTSRGQADERVRLTLDLMQPLRNVNVLERPVRPNTIVTALEAALRDRRRQYEVRDALEALRNANARADAALVAGDMGTWIWDIVENRIYADRNLARMFGVSEETADGGPLERYLEAMHPHDRSRVGAQIQRALAAGESYETDYRLVRPDGEVRWVNARGRAEIDGEGKPIRMPGVVVDITRRKATEEALAASRAREATILSSIADGFYALDRQYRFILFNDACERYFGLRRADVLGQPYFEVFPQVRGTLFQSRLEAVMEREEAQHFEARSVVTGIKIAMHIYPSPEGLTVLFSDVTERDATRAALEKSQEQLYLAQRAARVGTFSWDIPNDWIVWSPELEALYGVPEGTFEGSFDDWRRRVVPDDVRRVEPEIMACMADRRRELVYEFRAVLPDGTLRWLEGQARFEYDGERPIRMLGANVDIDARKRAEAALREANADLERRVEARTADLVAKIGELEGFCYSVSHDMRTPLRAIVSNAAIVLEEQGDQVGEDGRERLERLSAAAVKMARLIDDLLQYARLGASAPRREPIDLSALATQVADEAIADRGGHAEIVVEPGMRTHGDPRLLGLVMHNLVDNALKYQPPGAQARVAIGREPEGAFYVRDNGIGFDMRYASKIFKAFERLHRDSEYSGTGIGLANVQRIVEAHGGRIWAESEPGVGTTFRFTLG